MRKPTLIGAAVAVLTAGGGFLLGISPLKAATADLREQLDSVEASNDTTRARIPALKAQLETISTQVDHLRELSGRVPPSIDLPSLYAELDAVATAAGPGVAVENVNVAAPQLITPDAQPPATDPPPSTEPAPQDGADVGEAGDSDSEGPATPAPSAVLAAYTVTMTVTAEPGQAAAFLAAMADSPRLNVVSTSTLTASTQGAGSLNVTATYFLQQVDVEGLAAQIEELVAANGSPTTGATGPHGEVDDPPLPGQED